MHKFIFWLIIISIANSSCSLPSKNISKEELEKTNTQTLDKHIKLNQTNSFYCVLSTEKVLYNQGETPLLKVEIINNTSDSVYFVGSLDGSSSKMRLPYCYFEIKDQHNSTIQFKNRRSCGNVNELRYEDFIKTPPAQSFNPYLEIDNYGFWSSWQIDGQNFTESGIYKFKFVYNSSNWNLDTVKNTPISIDHYAGIYRYNLVDSTTIPSLIRNDIIEKIKNTAQIDIESNWIEVYYK